MAAVNIIRKILDLCMGLAQAADDIADCDLICLTPVNSKGKAAVRRSYFRPITSLWVVN
jgi:hypothetical protein